MAEILDTYTPDGIKIGTISKRDYYLKKHENIPWIKCCTCFIIDEKTNRILLEKRGKKSFGFRQTRFMLRARSIK